MIHIPEQARERPNICTVVRWDIDDADRVLEGTQVYLGRYAGTEVVLEDATGKADIYIVASVEDILLVEIE